MSAQVNVTVSTIKANVAPATNSRSKGTKIVKGSRVNEGVQGSGGYTKALAPAAFVLSARHIP